MERRLELIAEMTPAIWIHLIAVVIAVVIGAIVLFGRKGTPRHKLLGRIWAALMLTGALSSFWIMEIFDGFFSPIHLLSAWTLFSATAGVIAARRGNIRSHRFHMASLYASGLVIAGAFTFLPHRLLGRLTFGEIFPAINYAFVGCVAAFGIWMYVRTLRTARSKP